MHYFALMLRQFTNTCLRENIDDHECLQQRPLERRKPKQGPITEVALSSNKNECLSMVTATGRKYAISFHLLYEHCVFA